MDAPGFRPDAEAERETYGPVGLAIQRVGGGAVSLPYRLQFKFTVISVLWCEDPTQTILGYYARTAHQDYTLADNPGVNPPWKGTGGKTVIDEFQWHAGTAGLDPGMQVHD